MNSRLAVVLGGMVVMSIGVACARAADVPAGPARAAALKALEGMAAYSHKAPYSDAISDMYLGYDASGSVAKAVALRSFKTYETVTAMAVVTAQDGQYVVTQAEIPDVAAIKDPAKQKKVSDAVKDIRGKTVKGQDGSVHGIDAVTGATRYYSRIYATFDLLVRRAIEEMEKKPDWPKTSLGK